MSEWTEKGLGALPAKRNHRQRVRVHNKKLDLGRALRLRLNGATYEEIGQMYGVTRSAVHHALSAFKDVIERIDEGRAFRECEAEIRDLLAWEYTRIQFDKEKQAKATLGNMSYGDRNNFEMRRLLRNESTANVSSISRLVVEANRPQTPLDTPSDAPDTPETDTTTAHRATTATTAND